MDYVAKHAKALQKLRDDGAPVAFSKMTPGVYDPLTNEETDPVANVVAGRAVEIPGDLEEYREFELIPSQTKTLLFVPTEMGATPEIDSTVFWANELWTVKQHLPIQPTGILIADKVYIQ
jgi:hypothetical protein